MSRKIIFEFEGRKYELDAEAYKSNMIVLPGGRMLRVGGWVESYTPWPLELTDMKLTVQDLISLVGGGSWTNSLPVAVEIKEKK